MKKKMIPMKGENHNLLPQIRCAIVPVLSLSILVCYAFLFFCTELKFAIPVLVGTSAVLMVLIAVIQYLGEKFDLFHSPALILLVALAIRCLFVAAPPELSDDIYRYVWDGLNTLCGQNPYALPPDKSILQTPQAAVIKPLVNHSHLVTIYPPGAQVVFAVGGFLSPDVFGIKVLLAFMDVFSCVAILRLLAAFKLPVYRGILYAWHPLPVLEISGSGHIDAAGIFFIVVSALLLMISVRSTPAAKRFHISVLRLFSGAAFAWAFLIKLYPALFFPAFLTFIGRKQKRVFVFGAILAGLCLILPFLPEIQNMFLTLAQYTRHWEFSGLAYRLFVRLGASGITARYTLLSVFVVCFLVLSAKSGVWSFQDRHKQGLKELSNVFQYIYGINILFLLLTPTLHPWYGLYLVAILPFFPQLFGFILSWSLFLAYYVLIGFHLTGLWVENDFIPVLIWMGPLFGFLAQKSVMSGKKVLPGK